MKLLNIIKIRWFIRRYQDCSSVIGRSAIPGRVYRVPAICAVSVPVHLFAPHFRHPLSYEKQGAGGRYGRTSQPAGAASCKNLDAVCLFTARSKNFCRELLADGRVQILGYTKHKEVIRLSARAFPVSPADMRSPETARGAEACVRHPPQQRLTAGRPFVIRPEHLRKRGLHDTD